MNMWESVRMAFRSLSANKLRSALTMLGIIIGTGAVIALLSVGQGAQRAITEQIQSIGSNLIYIFPGQMEQGTGQLTGYSPLVRSDAEALEDPVEAPLVAGVAPEIDRSADLTYGSETVNVTVVGTTSAYQYVYNRPTVYGSFFTEGDDTVGGRVVLLGYQTAEDLFGDPGFAVGQTVRVNRVPFRVVGVLEEKGGRGVGGASMDEMAIVPLTTAQQRLFGEQVSSSRGRTVDYIGVSAVDEESIDAAIEQISWILRDERGLDFEDDDDFSVVSQQDILGVFTQITSYLTIFLGAIAGISLLVGGIGIMNIMLVSVTERTREIGIRKAVGARRSDILWQFLIESIVLSIIGGAAGILFGWGVAAFVNTLDVFETFVSGQAVALAVSFSVAVGLFFGIYPANRAANLNPIEALHYE